MQACRWPTISLCPMSEEVPRQNRHQKAFEHTWRRKALPVHIEQKIEAKETLTRQTSCCREIVQLPPLQQEVSHASELPAHQFHCHGMGQQRLYSCLECGKKFTSVMNAKRLKTIHTGFVAVDSIASSSKKLPESWTWEVSHQRWKKKDYYPRHLNRNNPLSMYSIITKVQCIPSDWMRSHLAWFRVQ